MVMTQGQFFLSKIVEISESSAIIYDLARE